MSPALSIARLCISWYKIMLENASGGAEMYVDSRLFAPLTGDIPTYAACIDTWLQHTRSHILCLRHFHTTGQDCGHAHSTLLPPIDRSNLFPNKWQDLGLNVVASGAARSPSLLVRLIYVIGCHNGCICTTSALPSLAPHRFSNSSVTLDGSCVIHIALDEWPHFNMRERVSLPLFIDRPFFRMFICSVSTMSLLYELYYAIVRQSSVLQHCTNPDLTTTRPLWNSLPRGMHVALAIRLTAQMRLLKVTVIAERKGRPPSSYARE